MVYIKSKQCLPAEKVKNCPAANNIYVEIWNFQSLTHVVLSSPNEIIVIVIEEKPIKFYKTLTISIKQLKLVYKFLTYFFLLCMYCFLIFFVIFFLRNICIGFPIPI